MNTCDGDYYGEVGLADIGIDEIDCVTEAVVVADEF